MDLSYITTPFVAWLIAGSLKFVINTIKVRRFAFNLIGYGGFPSNHSSIASSTVAIIAFNEGFQEPALAVALAFSFIVILDANSLRQQVGKHAKAINIMSKNNSTYPLREKMGHTQVEILAGIITGIASAGIVYYLFN